MGICTLAFLTPQISIVPNSQSLIVPLAVYTQSKRAIQVIPLMIAVLECYMPHTESTVVKKIHMTRVLMKLTISGGDRC